MSRISEALKTAKSEKSNAIDYLIVNIEKDNPVTIKNSLEEAEKWQRIVDILEKQIESHKLNKKEKS